MACWVFFLIKTLPACSDNIIKLRILPQRSLSSQCGLRVQYFSAAIVVFTLIKHQYSLTLLTPIECRSEKIFEHQRISVSTIQSLSRTSVQEVKLPSTPYLHLWDMLTKTPGSTTSFVRDSVQKAHITDSTWCKSELCSTQNDSKFQEWHWRNANGICETLRFKIEIGPKTQMQLVSKYRSNISERWLNMSSQPDKR